MEEKKPMSTETIEGPTGAVMVVGGGIAGMQASLDLADSGFQVYLVEESGAIGGHMAQLDKTFPTNDCSMCIVSPKLVGVGRHRNIELLTLSEVESVDGEAGNLTVRLTEHVRYVDLDRCTGCGLCEERCPVSHRPIPPPPVEEGDGDKPGKKPKRGNTVAVIEAAADIAGAPGGWRFEVDDGLCKKCGLCHKACPVGAIEWEKKELARIDQAKCIHCGACLAACPTRFDAIVFHEEGLEARDLKKALSDRAAALANQYRENRDGQCILCGLCVLTCNRVIGAGALTFHGRAVEVGKDACRACGACTSVCPKGCLDVADLTTVEPRPLKHEFNVGLAPRRAVAIPYPQAVPRAPVIDASACIHQLYGDCGICEAVCDAGAIAYHEQERRREIKVGSVILAPGYEAFPAEGRGEFGYGRYPNVITSLEFERFLSASGPTEGHILRPGDRTEPRRVAWIQCVGSRDHSIERDYCSSVCCMYATKEALIAKEHDDRIEATIFYIDLRAFGKNFDDYVDRAKEHYGVRYVRTMVSRIFEDPVTGNLELRYVDDAGKQVREEFDMVVLSVGLQIHEKTKALAGRLGVDIDEYGFARTDPFKPQATSRPGLFVCGVFSGPKDIPESVCEASGAATAAAADLAIVRGSMVAEETFPAERGIPADEAPRIGVFVCHCGINIASVVDVEDVAAYARTLPGVVFADNLLYTCSQDNQETVSRIAREQNLNRVVIAACSPRTHEELFQQTLMQGGMNRYLFEMANIRDQCSWVHHTDDARATDKAKRLMRMAVAKVTWSEPLEEREFDVDSNLLVVGGGLAGMTAALDAAHQGFGVYLIEREAELGGNLLRLRRTAESRALGDFLAGLKDEIDAEPGIRVFTNSQIVEHGGYVGNFETEIMTPAGVSRTIKHGAVLVATGGEEARPAVFGLDEEERVVTQSDFERLINDDAEAAARLGHVVMIQCAGSRDETLPYCSRVCCNQAIKNARAFKERVPSARVDILYRDIRSYGLSEIHYRAARLEGVNFIRYDPETNPVVVEHTEGGTTVKLRDPSVRRPVALKPDLLVLSTGVVPHENEELGTMLRIPRTEAGFFIEAHAKLRPVDFASEGLFLAGLAHYPKSIPETIAQASAAVGRAATILAQPKLKLSGVVSTVDPEHCAVCLTCVRECPYHVPVINPETHAAEINPALCQGCGICVAECPAKTITLGHFTDRQLWAKIEALEEKPPAPVSQGGD